MSAVLLTCYNNAWLTKKALRSIITQDLDGLEVVVVNNGSTDDTKESLCEFTNLYPELIADNLTGNRSPVLLANKYLDMLFRVQGHDTVLCVPNDVVLPRNLYSEMLKWPRGAVTASMTEDPNFPHFSTAAAVNECTPMCVIMWRKWVYEAVMVKDGYFFDENFFMYASDCDLALRMSACGIRGLQLDIQYYHYGSASHRLASPEDGDRMRSQADLDRAYFRKKWGWDVTDHNYGQAAMDINFKG